MLFPSDMVAFLGAGDVGRRAAEQAIEAASKHAEAFGGRTSYAVRAKCVCWLRCRARG